jgi:hypothetical protein
LSSEKMGKRKHPKKRIPGYTPLDSQRKEGTKLRGPLASLNPTLIDWPRDLLPEHLWLAALADKVGLDGLPGAYNAFMDALDAHWPHAFVALGLISDFGLVPEAERGPFLEKNRALVGELFHGPIGRIMSLYPDGPAAWLVDQKLLSDGGPVDPFAELGHLRRLVLMLAPGKDRFAGRIRAIPLRQLLKHKKISFAKDLPVVSLLPRYPNGLSEEEKYHVESCVRSLLNGLFPLRKMPDSLAWPKYFWRHNYDLVPCRLAERRVVGGVSVSASDGEELAKKLAENAVAARDYLDLLRIQLRPDLYDPRRDEVLFGLFARVTRLYVLMAEDPFLWARDTSGMMLRPLADSAITFAYLAKAGTAEDFRAFVEYGEGQQKLLMLHLQDNYPGEKSLEDLSAEELANEFDVWPKVLDIELRHWTKKDPRRLAREADMEDLYRLVFTPASSDLHGSWLSLKASNLVRCSEPLHRWHRIPTFVEPPFFVNTAVAAQNLYERCRALGVERLTYPVATAGLRDLSSLGQAKPKMAVPVDDPDATPPETE